MKFLLRFTFLAVVAGLGFPSRGLASYSLSFSDYTATTGSMSVTTGSGSHTVSYKLWQNVVTCTSPVDYQYESMNVFEPTAIDGTAIDASKAPILFENNVGGYMASSVYGSSSVATNGGYALAAGFVVVEAGCRGRDNSSTALGYYGKAPAAIVDLKAAIAFIRYNSGKFPGNVDAIFSSGGSAGGALSTLLGASGNSSLYESYLTALGAASANTNILGVVAYSPITNLDNADMCYEWEYGTASYSGGTVNQTISAELKSAFQTYQNGLALTGDNSYGTLTASNINDYILQTYLIPSATKYLAALSSSDRTTYLSSHTWITWDSTTSKASFTFADYVSYLGRSKSVPAFDAFFDLSSSVSYSNVNTSTTAEVAEFGNGTTNARHFTDFSLLVSTNNSSATLGSDIPTLVNLMNPMDFIAQKNSGIASYWFIRDGAKATDTSAIVIIDLATALENLLGSSHVNAWEYWDGGHNVNQDPDAMITWISGITGYTAVSSSSGTSTSSASGTSTSTSSGTSTSSSSTSSTTSGSSTTGSSSSGGGGGGAPSPLFALTLGLLAALRFRRRQGGGRRPFPSN